MIGEGGFGKVFKVQHNLDQRHYAIKQIQIYLGLNQDFKKHFVYREIVAISKVQHKNVVRYYACWIENQEPKRDTVTRIIKKIKHKEGDKPAL